MATQTPERERSDLRMRRDVLNELRLDPRRRPNGIAVSVHDGIVSLAGWVDTYNKKWAADRAERWVKGLQADADDTDVRWPIDSAAH